MRKMHLLAFTSKPYIDGDYDMFSWIILMVLPLHYLATICIPQDGFDFIIPWHNNDYFIITQLVSCYPTENAKYSPNGLLY